VKITWKKNSCADKYSVLIRSDGKWKLLKTTTKNYFYDTKNYGSRHTYCIRAIKGKSGQSARSSSVKLYCVNPNKKMIALTFDDGPYSPVTNKLLKLLKKYNARATFFVVGSRLSEYKDCLVKEAKQGCEIGIHTYNHTMLPYVSAKTIQKEISSTASLIEKYSGQTPKIARAPGGDVNDFVLENVDYPLFNWSIDTLDWKSRNSTSVANIAESNAYDGAIILMHDLYFSTGDANESIIPYLVKQGYQLVTVSEMMDAKGFNVKKGQLYCSAYTGT